MKRTVAVAGLVCVVVLAAVLASMQLGRWLSEPAELRVVDVIVVPAGDPDRRLASALDLVEQGVSDRVWVMVSEPGPVLHERQAVRAYARERETQAELGILGVTGSTREDARLVSRALSRGESDAPGIGATIGVVTSPERIARTRITFERIIGDQASVVVWSDGSAYDAQRWWTDDAADTIVETAKLVGTLALVGPSTVVGIEGTGASRPLRGVVAAGLAALVAGFVLRPVARRLGLVARPRLFRVSPRPTPLLGGAAILFGMGVGVLAGGGVRLSALGAVAMGGIVVLALVGVIDDLAGLGPRTRLFWAAAAGAAAWLFGLRAGVLPPGTPAAEVTDAIVTLLWFVGVTHALNVLDHVDGAAGGVAAVSAAWIAVIAVAGGQVVVALGAAALCGAALGYLFHNFPPARLFMGDMGALGIGFALAALALAMQPPQPPPLARAVAVLVVGVPIFDVVLVTISRLRLRHRVSVGGTDHTTHRLIRRGLPVRRASAFLWASQLVLGAIAFAVVVAPRPVAWALVVVTGIAGLVALVVFLRLPPWHSAAPKASEAVLVGIEDALGALGRFQEAAAADGLSSTDPSTTRAVRGVVQRLEGMRRRLRTDEPPRRK